MSEFKQYRRTQIAEMRPIVQDDIEKYQLLGFIPTGLEYKKKPIIVSISDSDKINGSPKIGDMVARNPKNHEDQWLVASRYFKDNFVDLN